ncbi:MAG TPA: hypothetical protein VFE78_28715, partial [Gemmataceae bacterium]|nr:hypothetical protein [Gemmataceae bacterium]
MNALLRPASLLACFLLSAVAAPAAGAARKDRAGDPLPDGALARLGSGLFRMGTFTHLACLSPDGKLLAVAANNGEVRLVETATGKEARRIKAGPGSQSLQFSPDGKALASTWFDGTVRLYDVASGSQTQQVAGGNGRAGAVQ